MIEATLGCLEACRTAWGAATGTEEMEEADMGGGVSVFGVCITLRILEVVFLIGEPFGMVVGVGGMEVLLDALVLEPVSDGVERVPRREEQVLELLADGRSNAEIAARLYITEGTAKTHVKHVLRKVGVSNRSEAGALHRGTRPGRRAG